MVLTRAQKRRLPSPLLALPLELQHNIFQEVYSEPCILKAVGSGGFKDMKRSGTRTSGTPSSVALLLTCRHTYLEALQYYRQSFIGINTWWEDQALSLILNLKNQGRQWLLQGMTSLKLMWYHTVHPVIDVILTLLPKLEQITFVRRREWFGFRRSVDFVRAEYNDPAEQEDMRAWTGRLMTVQKYRLPQYLDIKVICYEDIHDEQAENTQRVVSHPHPFL